MSYFDVLLPVKNGNPYFRFSIESIQNQSFHDWRLIILDHGSNDGSFELAKTYSLKDNRIIVYQCADAVGLSNLLNFGLDLCESEFVIRQDADDISLPNRFQEIFNFIKIRPNISLIGSHMQVINGEGNLSNFLEAPISEFDIRCAMLFRTTFFHPTVAMRLATLKKFNLKYGICLNKHAEAEFLADGVKGLAEDYLLFGQMICLSQVENIPKVLVKYRWHGGNVGSKNKIAQRLKAIQISRYLSKYLSEIYNVNYVDPAAYTNHGNRLSSGINYFFADNFLNLKKFYYHVYGPESVFSRELAFRWVIADRRYFRMLARYLIFIYRHGLRRSEFASVFGWIFGRFFPSRF